MNQQKPSVGRVVHYVSHGTPAREDGTRAYTSECCAAIITGTYGHDQPEGEVALCVLNPTGMAFNEHVFQDEGGHVGGTWHWPERVA